MNTADIRRTIQEHTDAVRVELDAPVLRHENYVLRAPGLGNWFAVVQDDVLRYRPNVLHASRWSERDARRIVRTFVPSSPDGQLVAVPYVEVLRETLASGVALLADITD